MNSSKFNHIHVYLIGGVLLLIVGLGMFFGIIRPINEEIKSLVSQIDGTRNTTVSVDGKTFNIAAAPGAKKQLEVLKDRQQRKKAELAVLERRKQLPADQALDLGTGQPDYLLSHTLPRWLLLPKNVVNTMSAYNKSIAKKRGKGFTVVGTFSAPAPSTDPSTVPKDIVAWNLGTLALHGKFQDVMAYVEDWNNAPLLTAVDGLKFSLADRNGIVDASCSISVFVFPTGEVAANIPAGGASAPAGGAMPGAMPGAMSGPGGGGGNGPGR